ncbi:MAG: M48 family metallopeptidase [Bacteroidota bacterium]
MSKAYKLVKTKLEIAAGLYVPVKKYYEYRSGYRASVGKNAIIFRLPILVDPRKGDIDQAAKDIEEKLIKWVFDTYKRKPEAFSRLLPALVPAAGYLVVMGEKYQIQITKDSSYKSHRAELDKHNPYLVKILLTHLEKRTEAAIVDTLLSRIFADRYKFSVWQRLQALNAQHFNVHVDGLRLKNTTSVWGSCTHNGNINLSSRLLLVPSVARDSVIIHELAHRIEMNHSKRFWKLVYDAMPDYDNAHGILKKYGKTIRFLPVRD